MTTLRPTRPSLGSSRTGPTTTRTPDNGRPIVSTTTAARSSCDQEGSPMGEEPTPERPRDAGVPEDYPASTSAIEGAHVLANEARERLHADGFNDDQIDL